MAAAGLGARQLLATRAVPRIDHRTLLRRPQVRCATVCQAAKGYTQRVARCAAILTLVAFALLAGTDKFCCPDGCTAQTDKSAPTQSGPHPAPHTCVLCVLGVEAADAPRSDIPVGLVASVVPALTPPLPTGIPLSLDHPPRRA